MSQTVEAKRAWAKRWREANPELDRQRWADWHAANPEKVKASHAKYNRKRHLRAKYGLAVEDYEQMAFGQGGLCAICRRPPASGPLDVDHDHLTGRVRKLLCGTCNLMLAGAQDNIERLSEGIAYLELHSA
jgi:hypothetical protein